MKPIHFIFLFIAIVAIIIACGNNNTSLPASHSDEADPIGLGNEAN